MTDSSVFKSAPVKKSTGLLMSQKWMQNRKISKIV